MSLPQAQQAVQNLLSSVFGYLSGADLSGWCDPQILLTAEDKVPTILRRSCNQAISEIESALQNKYDLTVELLKTDIIPPVATTALTAGVLSGTNILLKGYGLSVAPTVTVVNDPKDTVGAGATVTAQISASILSTIHLLTGGRHYKSAPNVVISGGGGAGATATATISAWGSVDNITITNPGTGYTTVPSVSFISIDGFGFGAYAVGAVQFGQLTGLTITSGGVGYTAAPTLKFDMLAQQTDTRNPKLVKIMSIYAVRNAMGQAQNVSKPMEAFFAMADDMVADLKAGLSSLPLFGAAKEIRSDIQIIQDRFHTLG